MGTETDSHKLLLSTGEVQHSLSLGRTTVFALIRDGEIQTVRIGRRRLIPQKSLSDYVERLRAAEHQSESA